MAKIVRRRFLLILFVVMLTTFCSTQPGRGQGQGQSQPSRTLAHFIQARQNLRQSHQQKPQGRQGLVIWDNELDVVTCGSLWNIHFGDKCVDPDSPTYLANFKAIFTKYNIDEDTLIVDNDPDKEFPLAADRDISELNCADLPKFTICVGEKCVCRDNPCDESPLPTQITLEECHRKVDGDPVQKTGQSSGGQEQTRRSTTLGLEGLGGASGTDPSCQRQSQSQRRQLLVITISSILVSVTLLSAAFRAAAAV